MESANFTHNDESVKIVPNRKEVRSKKILGMASFVAAIVLVITGIPTVLAFGYNQMFSDKIFPSVKVYGQSLTGLTRDQATKLLTRETNNLLENGITFVLDGERFTISKTQIDANALVTFTIPQIVDQAYNIGRTGTVIEQTLTRYRSLLGGNRLTLGIQVDEQSIAEQVSAHFAKQVKQAKNAEPQIKVDGSGQVTSISIAAAQSGTEPKFIDAVREFSSNLRNNKNSNINIQVNIITPVITVKDAEPHLAELATLLNPREIRIVHENQSWPLSRTQIAKALTFIKTADGSVQAGINPTALAAFFKPIRKVVEVAAQNAIFTMKGDKVVEFIPHKNGVGIDEASFAQIAKDALYQNKAGMELPLKPTEPEITTEKSNKLGIKEALGTGTSSFKGSPTNRIKNIRNGANRLNLSLIAPNQEFSLVSVLKPFDEDGGYVPELVIKGSKLEPEIGGGLCQIGTTTFRAVMNSGLPVTERRNHSLVVSYYNDPMNGNPGSDATIYDPSPDFKFKNDTGKYILISAKYTAQNALNFTIYGTSDGRKGSYTAPEVSKWTPVPKDAGTLYLESTSVKSGEQKCKNGFPGAVASMTYTIQKPDGTKVDQVFTSIYRMLPPVCLVAKGEIPPPTPATPTTPSPAVDIPIPALDAGEVSN